MRSNHFKLEPPIWTPLGGACSDYLQAPGCGFLCGEINFVWTSLYQPAATSQKFHFHSDYVNSLSGFLIEYEQLYHC
uniref:Uncharacterized protein n=1 Tax=Timema cristinae TaxID=61476 RepID=A0A7R9D725_TIMCR|nr:unnamed protein product [Timema cristinae]